MSSRGYLWENLSRDVAEEFDALGTSFDLSKLELQRWIVSDRTANMEDARERAALGPRLRQAIATMNRRDARRGECRTCGAEDHTVRNCPEREVRRRAGLCVECGVPRPRLDALYCTEHQVKEKEMREKLPNDRCGVTTKFRVISPREDNPGQTHEIKGYITANIYPTDHPLAGRLGEVFVKVGKPGEAAALLDQWAMNFSRELQRGEDVNALCQKHRHTQFLPYGAVVGVEGITRCTSLLDLVCHFLQRKFCGLDETRGTL